MLILLGLLLVSSVYSDSGCRVNGVDRFHGEEWDLGGFIKNCTTFPEGGWRTNIVACTTRGGQRVQLGSEVEEDNFVVRCVGTRNGGAQREFHRVFECQGGHRIGEEFTSDDSHFQYKCTERGSEIINCLTDSGVIIPVNGELVEGNVRFVCEGRGGNGAVNLLRKPTGSVRSPENRVSEEDEGLLPPAPIPIVSSLATSPPLPNSFGPPSIAPPPSYRRDMEEENTVDGEEEAEKEVSSAFVVPPPSNSMTCIGDGRVRQPEDTWISERKFTKKCTPSGAVVILNCVINDNENVTINIDSTVRIGKKVYTCTRKQGSVFYEEHSV